MTPKKSKINPSSQSGGFGYGLIFGAAAGAITYFLFGTEKGNHLRTDLIEYYKSFDGSQKSSSQFYEKNTSTKIQSNSNPALPAAPQSLQPLPTLNNLEQAKSMLEMLADKVNALSSTANQSQFRPKKYHKARFKSK